MPTATVERRAFEHRVTAEGVLEAALSTQITVPPEVEGRVRLLWIAPDGARVEAGEVVARLDGRDLEDALERGSNNLRSTDFKVDKQEVESAARIASLGKDERLARLELEVAQRFQKVDEDVFSRREILESRIDGELAEQRKEHAEGARETEGELGRTELELLEIDRRQARLEIDRARRGLEALEIRAPHAGVLSLARGWRGDTVRVGSELWKGQPIAEIPDLSKLQASVYVLEADAGGLEVGRTATVVVEAHPEMPIAATLERVDSVAQPRFRGSPVQYFGVVLELEHTDPKLMKPGQRVRASLLLEELADVLVVPRSALWSEGGESWVRVREGGGFVPRKVEVGAASLGWVVIEAGLEEGDVVALEPAKSSGSEADSETGSETGSETAEGGT